MKLSRLAAAVFVGALAIVAVPSPTGAAQEPQRTTPGKIDLRPKWKVGQETRFKMEMDTSGTQNTPGAGEGTPLKQTMGATMLFRCKDTNPETGSTLEVTYESLKMNLKSPLMNIDFDSTRPANPDDPMDAVIRPILETRLSVKMDKDGNITSVDGGPGGMAEQFTSADLLKGMFGPMVGSKQPGSAAVGEKWTTDTTMDAGNGTVRIATTYTLKTLMGSLATVDISGRFSLDPSSAGQGVTIRDSGYTGDYKWDVEAGMLESMQTKQKLTVEQKQTKDNPTPMRTSQDSTMKVTRVRSAPGAPARTPATPPPGPTPKDWGPIRK